MADPWSRAHFQVFKEEQVQGPLSTSQLRFNLHTTILVTHERSLCPSLAPWPREEPMCNMSLCKHLEKEGRLW